jgi:hypothetical protein
MCHLVQVHLDIQRHCLDHKLILLDFARSFTLNTLIFSFV